MSSVREWIVHLPLWVELVVFAVFWLLIWWLFKRIVFKRLSNWTIKKGIRFNTSFLNILVNILVWGLGIFILLDLLGITLTPFLASLGIGSLAVGLALQDTLSNLFAGFYLTLDRPARTGDYIRLASGEEGYVEKIGWRSTQVRMLPNNMFVIPNSKLASSIFTNFYLPDRELAVLVDVGVSYNCDLEKVEKITGEVGRALMQEVDGGVRDFKPFIRYNKFGDSSINFTVILRGREYVDQYLIKHEFIKRLHERYRKEGIEIPYPQRTIHMVDSRNS